MGNPNFGIWKEPRGFLKCLQVFLAIFAFSCAVGFRGKFTILQKCTVKDAVESHSATGTFKYPFDQKVTLSLMKAGTNCSNEFEEQKLSIDKRSSTEFFVVIGVFCFLMSLGMLAYYVYFEDVEAKIRAKQSGVVNWLSGPVVDFLIAVFYAFFWFVAAIAQAAAVTGIKDATNANTIIKNLSQCTDTNMACSVTSHSKYSTLTVSILLGFLNSFVWAGNCWFLWKETPWHSEQIPQPQQQQQQQQQQQPHQQIPSAI